MEISVKSVSLSAPGCGRGVDGNMGGRSVILIAQDREETEKTTEGRKLIVPRDPRYNGRKKSPEETKLVVLRDENYFRNTRSPAPAARHNRELMENEEGRSFLAEAVRAGRLAFKMKPVQSNAELLERIDQYFETVENRRVPPTVEEFGLFIGYTSHQLFDWMSGHSRGFPDQPYPGCTTANVCQKVVNLLHTLDAAQVAKNQMNSVAYIFRSKNYYGMVDKQEITVEASQKDQPLSPDEIAKRLAPPDDTVDLIDADYDII